MPETNKIICGAMPEATKVFPDGYFNCSISSPPYWALRDYGVAGQLGLEPTFEEYIDKLCTIYDEVKRVLRDDGTCWVNLGDTYGGQGGSNWTSSNEDVQKWIGNKQSAGQDFKINKGIKEKCLCLIPQRFAIEMVNRGWILRNVIIWHKPNPMPSSAKDRFTVDFEYVYFFVKSKKYWFEPQYEPYLTNDGSTSLVCGFRETPPGQSEHSGKTKTRDTFYQGLGRNKRTVWTIPTQPYPEAHFATFPEKLVKPMIKAGCPEFVCTKCGKAREKVFDVSYESAGGKGDEKYDTNNQSGGLESGACTPQSMKYGRANKITTPIGYTDCGCNAEWRPGIVLDAFAGSCTTGKVAAKLRRDYIMIDLKPEYIEMGEKRVMEGETGILIKEQKAGQMALFR